MFVSSKPLEKSPVPVSEANAPPCVERGRAEDTGVARLLDRLLARELRVLLVLLHLVLALGAVRVLLAHLALVERHGRAGAARLVVAVVRLVLFLGRRRIVLRRAVRAGRRVLERREVDVRAESSSGICYEHEPEAEVRRERAERSTRARGSRAPRTAASRGGAAAEPTRRGTWSCRRGRESSRSRGIGEIERAALRGELGERRRLAVDDHLAFHAGQKLNTKSSPCGATSGKSADGAPSVGNSTPGAVPMRKYGLLLLVRMRASAAGHEARSRRTGRRTPCSRRPARACAGGSRKPGFFRTCVS